MSRKRFQDDRGYVDPSKLPKGPNGRALCRWCKQEVRGRRKTFCSAACIHEHRLRTDSSYMRSCVFKRDHGICAACGLDTVALSKLLLSIWLDDPKAAHANAWIFGFGNAFLHVRESWRHGYKPRSLWAADHIIPVVEGGGECDTENIRTLCTPCHKKVTTELAGRTAARRKKSPR